MGGMKFSSIPELTDKEGFVPGVSDNEDGNITKAVFTPVGESLHEFKQNGGRFTKSVKFVDQSGAEL